MGEFQLKFTKPERVQLRTERREKHEYPQEMRLVLDVYYNKVKLVDPTDKYLFEDKPVNLNIITSKGNIYLFNPSSRETIKIRAGIDNFWQALSYPPHVRIVPEPLSLRELHEIDELLRVTSIGLSWEIECLGFLEDDAFKLNKPIKISFEGPQGGGMKISRQDFVKDVLEPADMLRREFIEVIVEPIDEEKLDKFSPEFREALRILLEKQKLLLTALKKLEYVTTTDDYRNVIDDVWRSIEGLTPRKPAGLKVYRALKLAFKVLPIAREIDSGALDEVAQELSETLLGKSMNSDGKGKGSKNVLNNFSDAIFKYASALRHGTLTAGSGKAYNSLPSKNDAEFAVLQAMLLLNYLIKTLKTAGLRS